MKTLKIEKEVTKKDVYVKAESVEDSLEIRAILEAAEEVVDESIPYTPQNTYLMFGGVDNDWFYNQINLGHYKITMPQLAELLGVEYPLKPKFEAGKWYIAKRGTNIFCHNGKFDEDDDPCGYGVVCDANWAVANDVGWGGPYREATASEVERALIAEAKRRYKVGDRVSRVHCCNTGSMYGEEPWVYKGVDDWLLQDNSLFNENLCLMLNGEWAEVIEEEKKLPTLEELIAEAKSKISKSTRQFPAWDCGGSKEVTTYTCYGVVYYSERLAIAGYISRKIYNEYL